jgi:hypothetical protein
MACLPIRKIPQPHRLRLKDKPVRSRPGKLGSQSPIPDQAHQTATIDPTSVRTTGSTAQASDNPVLRLTSCANPRNKKSQKSGSKSQHKHV